MMKKVLLTLAVVVAIPFVGQRLGATGNLAVAGTGGKAGADAEAVANTPGGNVTRNVVNSIDKDADIQGITIINGKVWIDGEAVPPNATTYRAKSGIAYRIDRRHGAVSVMKETESR